MSDSRRHHITWACDSLFAEEKNPWEYPPDLELWKFRHPSLMEKRNIEKYWARYDAEYYKWSMAVSAGETKSAFEDIKISEADLDYEYMRPNGYSMTDEEYKDFCEREPIRQEEVKLGRHRPSPSPTPSGTPHQANIPNKRHLRFDLHDVSNVRGTPPTADHVRSDKEFSNSSQWLHEGSFDGMQDLPQTPLGPEEGGRWTQAVQRPAIYYEDEQQHCPLPPISMRQGLPPDGASRPRKRKRPIMAMGDTNGEEDFVSRPRHLDDGSSSDGSQDTNRSMKRRKHTPYNMSDALPESRYPALFANATELLEPTVEKDDSERLVLVIEEQVKDIPAEDTTGDESMHDKTRGEADIAEADDDGERTPTPPEDPEIDKASLSLKRLPQPRVPSPETTSASRKRGRTIDERENEDYNFSDEQDQRSQRPAYDSEAEAPASKRHKQSHNNEDDNTEESDYNKVLTEVTQQPGLHMSSKSDSHQVVADEINADRHPTEAETEPESRQHAEDTVEDDTMQIDEEPSLPPPTMKVLRKVNDNKQGRRPCTRSQKAPNIALDMRKGGRVVVETTSGEKMVMTMAEYMKATKT